MWTLTPGGEASVPPLLLRPLSDGWCRAVPSGPLERRVLQFLAEVLTQCRVSALFAGATAGRFMVSRGFVVSPCIIVSP